MSDIFSKAGVHKKPRYSQCYVAFLHMSQNNKFFNFHFIISNIKIILIGNFEVYNPFWKPNI